MLQTMILGSEEYEVLASACILKPVRDFSDVTHNWDYETLEAYLVKQGSFYAVWTLELEINRTYPELTQKVNSFVIGSVGLEGEFELSNAIFEEICEKGTV